MSPPENDEGRRPLAGMAPLYVEQTKTSVRDGADNVTPMRPYPAAYASRFRPNAERTCWWISYRCPRCGESHFGRSTSEITGGVRRARCGRLVWLVISRTYGGREAAA